MRAIRCILVLWLSLAGLDGLAENALMAKAIGQNLTAASTSNSAASVDPNKAPSEFNHHIAGWALIGVGCLVLVSILYPSLVGLRYFWPALFLLMGLFLLLWSDAEIWPRGNLTWTWLLHHDHEAGQHKIYALLLMAIGVVEYLRAHDSLNRFWRAWAFPIFAIIGAAFLLIHDHTAGGGANSPEARAYLINPALDPDGKPPIQQPSDHPMDPMPGMELAMMAMDHSSMTMHGALDHSSVLSDDAALTNTSAGHHHHMTPSMLLVEREHFWFMIVGVGVALFKLISDGRFWRRRFVPYVWPSGMMLLGALLVLYRE
jgi:cell division protein FtsW (lipid II flippase)